jgi:hypothetical protein
MVRWHVVGKWEGGRVGVVVWSRYRKRGSLMLWSRWVRQERVGVE